MSDGVLALNSMGTTIGEQLSLQNLKSMDYEIGSVEYNVNIVRHEVRLPQHKDVAHERSLIIRQRLLGYKQNTE